MTRFSTDVDGLMEMVGYGLMIVVYAGGMLAFIIPTMFFIDWKNFASSFTTDAVHDTMYIFYREKTR